MPLPGRLRSIAKAFLPAPLRAALAAVAGRQPRAAKIDFGVPEAGAAPSPYAFPVASPNLLEQLGAKYQPTKRLHHYLPHYWTHFRDIREQVRCVLEIGLETDRSLRMWEEFFPNAAILGVDIDPACAAFAGGRRQVFIGDQSDPRFLASVLAQAPSAPDVVIDDGSHRVEHQVASLEFLFPRMSSHGIYVIEDTGGVVEDEALATVNAVKRLVDHVMYWPSGHAPRRWRELGAFGDEAAWADRNIIGVAFYRWMAVILRGRNPEDNPFLGPVESRREP